MYTYDNIMSWRAKRSHRRRKYIYGPGVDQPVCMIESAGSYAGTYYYHFDGLGSVVGLTNAGGNTVEVYEYDVYGRLGATDASHPNRFMFTGREFDEETGLYYYRARYYNPQIGRFLQTDPVGYSNGMNWYAYCGNNPANGTDASGEMSWWDWASTAYVRGVRDGDTREYFYQDVRFQTCAIQSTANLYVAQDGQLGDQRRDHLLVRMKDAWPNVVWSAVDRLSMAPGFIMDWFEKKMKEDTTRNDPEHSWATTGLPDLSYVAGFVRGDMAYELYSRPEGTRPEGVKGMDARLEKGPVLLALSTKDGGGRRDYNPSDFHCVVVRLSPGTTSKIDGEWKETPYEVIDPIWGKLYYTREEFAGILSLAANQMVVPK